MSYAFTFDASACSGCKACQIACKDKNDLPTGVLWRRVYEVSGGSWQQVGDAWSTDVFAYNLTLACNHCVHPKCAGVCPTDAFVVREDGIVYIDESKCMGCGYCSWACPYAAPRYNHESGFMTKCNFCYDNIDAGLPPACVAACPLRVLGFAEIRDQGTETIDRPLLSSKLWEVPATEHPFPLPDYSRTEPHLAIKPHAGMLNGLEKVVSNREEIRQQRSKVSPPRRSGRGRLWSPNTTWSPKSPDFGELPLVAFTLLGQMAAGMAVLSFFSGPLTTPILITLGTLIGLAGLASLFHLGAPVNAWRALAHLKKSWLSREILMFGLFGASWLVSLALPGMGKLPLALFGIGLVYSMAQVYRLRSVPAWNTDRTLFAFAVSAILLGGLGLLVIDFFTYIGDLVNLPLALIAVLGIALWTVLTERDSAHQTARRLRLGLTGIGLAGVLAIYFVPIAVGRWIMVPIFTMVLIEEGLGRWLFYKQLQRRNL
jgi:anaerobic dimethyl sulfoxide reductase subunit B